MKVIISHPTSSQFNRSLLSGLLEKKMLEEYHTGVASFPGSILYQMGGIAALSEIRRRSFQPELKSFTHNSPFYEIGRVMSGKLGISSYTKHETGTFCLDKVYQQLDKKVSRRLKKSKEIDAVYAYEDGALQTFQMAKLRGIVCLYDLPIGYWRAHRKYLENEKLNRPDWAMTLTNFKDSEKKLNCKDQELALADIIFVASNFTKKTLELYPGLLAPIHVIPYGFPAVFKNRTYERFFNRKLRLLFVGGLSQRKGIANLLEAAESLSEQVDLTIVGRKVVEECDALDKGLAKHTWITSMTNNEILDLMRAHDVFVFPSLFEGYGLVITEAMSQGTPVITTNRTCGVDFINDGENGWLVDAGNTDSLTQKLKAILANPELLKKVGKAAMATAEKLPLSIYGEKMAEAISNTVNKV